METVFNKVCVIGLGYIGLPTASMFATHGYKVTGVDVNKDVLKTLKDGKIHIEEPGLDTVVKAAVTSKNLVVSEKPVESDVFILAVPTPHQHSKDGSPKADLSYVEAALKSILPVLKKGNLIILESTSPPGTTRDVIVPMLEKASFKPGEEIGVAYCPERVIPGSALKELIDNDRVIGAINQAWGEKAKAFYKSFVSGDIFLTEPTVAEMVKVLENTYRDVNIALANEVAVMAQKLNINVWEVIELANKHPRVHVHKPGPGVGGHCISVDPWFLVEKFPDEAKLIQLARNSNDKMPSYVVSVMEKILDGIKKPKVAILGLAYKGNVDDLRESPALTIIDILKEKFPSWNLAINDPHVKSQKMKTVGIKEALQDADLAVVLTAHDDYKLVDPNEVSSLMKTRQVFDTHNLLKAERWVPAGFKFYTLGTGFSSFKNRVQSS